VFGYYIEISKSNLHAVPPDYHRKQTIAGGERFITPALKEYEEKVLGADERILEREIELFAQLRARVAAEAVRVQDTARALASLDTLAGLAETASLSNYTKPQVHEGDELLITDGRHPVVERRCLGVRAQRCRAGHEREPARPDRPQHGRQSIYLRHPH
jgi:DNA mismatch repair protein MutS